MRSLGHLNVELAVADGGPQRVTGTHLAHGGHDGPSPPVLQHRVSPVEHRQGAQGAQLRLQAAGLLLPMGQLGRQRSSSLLEQVVGPLAPLRYVGQMAMVEEPSPDDQEEEE